MNFKATVATIVALSMISSTAFAENGCPIGYDRIEPVNTNQVLVHGQAGNYLRTVANSDLCDNLRLSGNSGCCVRRSYQQSGGGGGIEIDHQTANALAAVAVIGLAAFLIHKHNKKVAAEKAESEIAMQQQPAPQQSAFEVASANEPETFVLDGVTYTKYRK
jgi:hypothetical protein